MRQRTGITLCVFFAYNIDNDKHSSVYSYCYFRKDSFNFASKKYRANNMKSEEKLRYSESELKEFEELILSKLQKSREELQHLKDSITRKNTGGDDNINSLKSLEDGADALEKEQLNQLAARTQKYITQLENALIRIKNGTYGICIDTGKLIPKERLRAVPHTQQTIEAKLNKMR